MRFSIRPSIKINECLTSWLMRTCYLNKVKITDLFAFLSPYYKNNDVRNLHHIDINPERIINLDSASILLNKTSKEIKSTTLSEALMKFHEDKDLSFINNSCTFLNGVLITSFRRFCVACLNECIYYKLSWQFKQVSHCLTHNIELTCLCTNCKMKQPYIHDNLLHAKCKYCNKSFINTKFERHIIINDVISDSIWYEKQWLFLLDPFVKLHYNPDSNLKNQLIINFIYICCNMESVFNIKQINYLSRDYKYKLINLLLHDDNHTRGFQISLKVLFSVLKRLDLDLLEFFKTKVPTSFHDSLNKYLERDKDLMAMCLSPWCEFYKTNLSLFQVTTGTSRKYRKIYFCTSCCLRYGFKRDSDKWEECEDYISIGYHKVLPLVKVGNSKLYISNYLGLSRYKVEKLISFCAAHKLISSTLINRFISDIEIKGKVLDYFIPLDILSEKDIVERLMKQHKWSKSKAYYHFFNQKVQQFLFYNDV